MEWNLIKFAKLQSKLCKSLKLSKLQNLNILIFSFLRKFLVNFYLFLDYY